MSTPMLRPPPPLATFHTRPRSVGPRHQTENGNQPQQAGRNFWSKTKRKKKTFNRPFRARFVSCASVAVFRTVPGMRAAGRETERRNPSAPTRRLAIGGGDSLQLKQNKTTTASCQPPGGPFRSPPPFLTPFHSAGCCSLPSATSLRPEQWFRVPGSLAPKVSNNHRESRMILHQFRCNPSLRGGVDKPSPSLRVVL